MRRRLGLAIYGRAGNNGARLALVPGWPPHEVPAGTCMVTKGRQPHLSRQERAYWEARGLHIYEEG